MISRKEKNSIGQQWFLLLVNIKSKARNVMEGGYTERHVNPLTYLTEPQGNIKI
jgi:hypothetical protein